jgi:thiamine biosynthesis lipoprotein
MNFNFKLIISFIFFSLLSCTNNKDTGAYKSIWGETMGTSYHIKYKGDIDLKSKIDTELIAINNELSTYIDSSTISIFNRSDTGIVISKSSGMWQNIIKAKKIHKLSNGYYDPTVMPLVNYWGFGYTGHKKPDSIDSTIINKILTKVGFDKIELIIVNKDSILVKKKIPGVQLDFSSIAKGYGVDVIGRLILDTGINDYLVEIGGEIVTSGLSPSGKKWVVGINTPRDNAKTNDLILDIDISDKALATSGNYRNFFDINGHKYSHTINPKTGFPQRSNLLSVSIITKDCMTADALATACMVSGFKWSKDIIENNDSIQGILIYLNNNKEMKVFNTYKNNKSND